MDFYYIEYLDSGEIVSIGESSSMDLALSNTTHKVMQLTEEQYAMVKACKGDIDRGVGILQRVYKKLMDTIESNSEE